MQPGVSKRKNRDRLLQSWQMLSPLETPSLETSLTSVHLRGGNGEASEKTTRQSYHTGRWTAEDSN